VKTYRFMIAICFLATAGCAVERTAPIKGPATTATPGTTEQPVRSLATAEAPTADVPGTPSEPATAPPPSAATTPPQPAAPASHTAAATPPADEIPTGTAAASSPLAPASSQPRAGTLDFTALGARLRATKAIGVLTKLSVKNQADDLLEQFRDYYQRRGTATLPDLRRSYDALVVKLLSLLRDGDPPLATDINRSRAAIWDVLSDQRKFVDSNLMAGASQ
jgi:hypothetical protein